MVAYSQLGIATHHCHRGIAVIAIFDTRVPRINPVVSKRQAATRVVPTATITGFEFSCSRNGRLFGIATTIRLDWEVQTPFNMVIVYVPFLIAVIIQTLPAPVSLGSTATAVTSGDFKVCPAESVRSALSPCLIVRVPDEVVTGAVTVTASACAGLLPAVFVAVTETFAASDA